MNNFSRRDALANAAAETLEKSKNQTLAEALYSSNRNPTPDGRGIFYIEDEDNLLAINNFIKKFLTGIHQHPHDVLARLFVNLQSAGLIVDKYDGGSGTYDVYQYGKLPSDHPVTGDQATDDLIFMRTKQHGKIKITKTPVPGGLYTVDATFYLAKDVKKNREPAPTQPFPQQK